MWIFSILFCYQVCLALLLVAGCSSQTPQPVVQVVSPSPATSSTPLPPALQPSASPYFNSGFRPFYPQPYFGGPQPAYFGAPQPAYFTAPQVSQPLIGTPSAPQRFVNGPYPTGSFVPILQQTFDITPEGSYTFRYVINMYTKYNGFVKNLNSNCSLIVYNKFKDYFHVPSYNQQAML